jgi:hypothetical protein
LDLSKLTTSDKVIAGGGIVLFIAQFLPWFKVSAGGDFGFSGISVTGNGFDVGFLWGTFPMLLGLLMVAQVAISVFAPDTKLPDMPATWGQIHLGMGALAAVLVILKLLIGESDEGIPGVDVTRQFGIFLATLAAIALAAGGFLKFQAEKADGGAGGPAAPGSTPPQPF